MMEEMSREWIEEFHEKSEMERNPDVREERMENFLEWFAKGETPEEIDLRIYSSSSEVLFLIRSSIRIRETIHRSVGSSRPPPISSWSWKQKKHFHPTHR